MIIRKGEKVHVIYRALYEKSTRRHFIGEVLQFEGSVCRLEGVVFIYDDVKTEFYKKQGRRTTMIDLAESGYIVNFIDDNVVVDDVVYKYISGEGLVATDGKNFMLNVNEFSARV